MKPEEFPQHLNSTKEKKVENPEKIEMSVETIRAISPEKGGTVMIFQRHAQYDRETGHLTPEGEQEASKFSKALLEETIKEIPDDERDTLKLLVVASPTKKGGGQRSVETAEVVLEAAKEVFERYNISEDNILVRTPRKAADIEEPRMFKEESEKGSSPTGLEYFFNLKEKYGKATPEFWEAYEEDRHKEEREALGAEGPVEMSDRFAHFTNVLGRYARRFHSFRENKGSSPERLLVWEVSHYDTIAAFFKNHVADIPKGQRVPVGYNGGLDIVIDKENNATVIVGDKEYPIELTNQGKKLARHKKLKTQESH